jgi:hypothetical protein
MMATSANAQINSPPPTLQGQPSVHLYTVPGAMMISAIATVFPCSNTSNAPIRVGVELFHDSGGPAFNDASSSSYEIPPGGARLFTTFPTITAFTLLGRSNVNTFSTGFGGSARILATSSSGIICSAFLVDAAEIQPPSMVALTIVKKTKQKGD